MNIEEENFKRQIIAEQESAIIFCQELLKKMIRKNVSEGINIVQSSWAFSRFENYKFVLNDETEIKIDLFKLFESGAIHTLYYHLLRIEPDDMSKAYHWFTVERLSFIKNKIKTWLGEEVSTYIETLS
jgi:hypothetical protein